VPQPVITEEGISHLPSPVRRSLARSGVIGRPVPQNVSLRQRGEILLRERWTSFTAGESYTLHPPSFNWKATVKLAGLPIARAEDSLTDGRGRMNVRALRLFTVVDEVGPQMDQGSVMRWLNETMWFPHVWATDLITWKPVDDLTAVGSVRVGDLTAEAEFCFDAEGRLGDFRADRYRIDESGSALTRWATPLTEHARFDGIEVPSRGAAVWAPDEEDLEYIRIELTHISYT
jgi:hypothetical protein